MIVEKVYSTSAVVWQWLEMEPLLLFSLKIEESGDVRTQRHKKRSALCKTDLDRLTSTDEKMFEKSRPGSDCKLNKNAYNQINQQIDEQAWNDTPDHWEPPF